VRVFILGATGRVGSAITDELISHSHTIVALARSDTAEKSLADKGADVVRGDLRTPGPWQGTIHDVDAIIHAAVTFGDDMGDVDRRMVQALIEEGENLTRPARFIFTGGCWLLLTVWPWKRGRQANTTTSRQNKASWHPI